MPTQREIEARRKGQKTSSPAPRARTPIYVENHECVKRSPESIGKLRCSCTNAPVVFRCSEPAIPSHYCTPDLPQKPGDGPVLMHDGSQTAERYMPYELRAGEQPRVHEAICCSTCPLRVEPPPEVLAVRRLGLWGDIPAAVLHLASPDWQDRCRTWMSAQVVRSCAMPVQGVEQTVDAIQRTEARVVVAHRLCVSAADMRNLSEQFPDRAFVALFHGSQNNLLGNPAWIGHQLEFLKLSSERPNVWYATPEETAGLSRFGWQRAIHWPSVMAVESLPAQQPHEPARLLVAGRLDPVKGIPCAVLAAGLVFRQRPVELLGALRDAHRLRPLAEAAGVPFSPRPWTDQGVFRRMIRQDVTVTIHPSLTDACPQVPWDSLAQGRPVVGSPCVRFLAPRNQPDPNDPQAIANATLAILGDYEAESLDAQRRAHEISLGAARQYQDLIDRLVG